MRVGLHDSDNCDFPNLALMKLSTWHREWCDDTVEMWQPDQQYDLVYSSKVFTFTPVEERLPANAVRGGTGYNLTTVLPPTSSGADQIICFINTSTVWVFSPEVAHAAVNGVLYPRRKATSDQPATLPILFTTDRRCCWTTMYYHTHTAFDRLSGPLSWLSRLTLTRDLTPD